MYQWWERGADKVCDACVANCTAHDDCAAVECHPTKPSRCLMWYGPSLLDHSVPAIDSIATSFLRNGDRTGIIKIDFETALNLVAISID